jgi:hypothetical protein
VLEFYARHRRYREAQIMAALSDGPATPAALVERIYADVDPTCGPRPSARPGRRSCCSSDGGEVAHGDDDVVRPTPDPPRPRSARTARDGRALAARSARGTQHRARLKVAGVRGPIRYGTATRTAGRTHVAEFLDSFDVERDALLSALGQVEDVWSRFQERGRSRSTTRTSPTR